MCQWFFGAILGSLAIPKLFRKFNAILGSFPYLHDRKPIIESDCELLCGLSPVCNGHRLFATDLCIGRRVFRGPYPKGKCLLFLVTLRICQWYPSTVFVVQIIRRIQDVKSKQIAPLAVVNNTETCGRILTAVESLFTKGFLRVLISRLSRELKVSGTSCLIFGRETNQESQCIVNERKTDLTKTFDPNLFRL